MRNSKRKSWLWKIIFLFLLIIFFLLIYISLKANIFSIRFVDLKRENVECLNEGRIKDLSLGKNIFLINEKNISDEIKKDFICVKSISFSKILPDKLNLDILGRRPVAQLMMSNSEASASSLIENIATPSAQGEAYLLDEEGVVFSKGNLDSPNIYILSKNIDLGFEDNYLKILKILDNSRKLQLDIKQSYVLNNLLIINSVPKIIFKLDFPLDLQIASLQLILKVAKIDNKELEFIDLRFDKPVIKYAPKKN